MQKIMFRKGLVAGIIVLFIGIGVQPAFAVDINNVSPSENIEDCNCEVVDVYDIVRIKSLLYRAERSLNRVETLTKLIPVLSKNNPEVEVEYKKLLNDIDTFEEIYDYLENGYLVDGRSICDKLEDIWWSIVWRGADYVGLTIHYLYEGKFILSFICLSLMFGCMLLDTSVNILYVLLGCGTLP